jgi:hypothetical protein
VKRVGDAKKEGFETKLLSESRRGWSGGNLARKRLERVTRFWKMGLFFVRGFAEYIMSKIFTS